MNTFALIKEASDFKDIALPTIADISDCNEIRLPFANETSVCKVEMLLRITDKSVCTVASWVDCNTDILFLIEEISV